MEHELEFVSSKTTGGHYAFRSKKSKKPFVNKMTEAISVTLTEDDVVADIGSYVGEYGLYAISQGVKKVKCYEPTPSSFEALKKNAKDGMEIYNAAVVGDDSTHVSLHMSDGVGVTNSIAKSARKKGGSIEVQALNYDEVVKDATVVKIDVEGAEYSYDIFKEHIRAYIIEFHTVSGIDWKSKAFEIIETLESNGYKPTYTPGFQNGWDMHGAWVKDQTN